MAKPKFLKKQLTLGISAILLSGLSASSFANNFYLENNQFTVKNNGAVIATATLGADGVLDTDGVNLPRVDVDSAALNAGLPSFEFTIDSDGLTAGSTSNFKVGLSIQDDADPSARRFEAYIGTLTLAVDGDKKVIGTIPAQAMYVRAKKGSATFYQAINNSTDNGPVTISGGKLSFSGPAAVALLKAAGNDVLDAVINDFTLNGAFTFRVVIEETTAVGAQVGVLTGSDFSAVPRIATACALDNKSTVDNVFQLITDTGFSKPYVVQGRFSSNKNALNTPPIAFTEECDAVGGSGGGGAAAGGGGSAPVEEASEEQQELAAEENVVNELQEALNDIDTSAPLEEAALEQISDLNTALESASEKLDTVIESEIESGSVSSTTVASSTNLATKSAAASKTVSDAIDSGSQLSNDQLLGALTSSAKTASSSSKVANASTDDEAKQAIIAQTKTILQNSAKILEALTKQTRDSDQQLTTAQTTSIVATAKNVTDAAETIVKNAGTSAEIISTTREIKRVLESQNNLGIPATTTQVTSVVNTSNAAAEALAIRQISAAIPTADTSNVEVLKTTIKEDRELLEQILDISIPIPPALIIPDQEINDRVTLILSTTSTLNQTLVSKVTESVKKQKNLKTIIANNGKSAFELFEGYFKRPITLSILSDRTVSALNEEATITVDETTNAVKVVTASGSYSAMITSISAASPLLPEGLVARPNGTGTLIVDGIAINLATNVYDLIKFVQTVDEAGFSFTQNDTASFTLDLGNNQKFSGAFAYDNLSGANLGSDCGTLSVIQPEGSENSASYAFGIQCSNGVLQRVLPYPEDANFYESNKSLGREVSTDRNTGIITIAGVGAFKPSFFTAEPTNAEKLSQLFYADTFGILYESADVNGDGVTDIKVISADSVQVLYGN